MGSPSSTCPGGNEEASARDDSSNNKQQKRMVIVGPEEVNNNIGPNIDIIRDVMSNEGGYFGNSNDAAVSVSPNNILDETRKHDDRRDDNDYLFDDDDQDLNNGDCTISNKKKMNTYRGYEELQVVNEFPFIVPSFSSSSLLQITKTSSMTKDDSVDVLPIAGFHTLTSTGNNTNETDKITFLVEVAKATIPKTRRKGWVKLPRNANKDFGMHCTATWVGPVNPSGRRRREWPLHRTMTLGVSYYLMICI